MPEPSAIDFSGTYARRAGHQCTGRDPRHWTASLMLAAGMDLAVVSRALRHSGIQLIVDTYGHIDDDLVRTEMGKFGAAMRSQSRANG